MEDLLPEEQLNEVKEKIKTETLDLSEEDFQTELRKRVYEIHTQIYMKTQEGVHARWPLESLIKRSWYHVKPLDDEQLDNWRKYLEFEEAQLEGKSDDEKNEQDKLIRNLYERCLVPCASYDEFWMRYIKYVLSFNGESEETYDLVNALYARAGKYFPNSNLNVRLHHAQFLESISRTEQAKEQYETLRSRRTLPLFFFEFRLIDSSS